jgi:hypothetical protein
LFGQQKGLSCSSKEINKKVIKNVYLYISLTFLACWCGNGRRIFLHFQQPVTKVDVFLNDGFENDEDFKFSPQVVPKQQPRNRPTDIIPSSISVLKTMQNQLSGRLLNVLFDSGSTKTSLPKRTTPSCRNRSPRKMRSNRMGLPHIHNSEKGWTDSLGLRLSTAQCHHQTKAVPPYGDT